MAHEMDIRVLGGLPVTVGYRIAGADRSVGIMSEYVDEWWITHINGRKVNKAPQWLYDRIEKSKGETERIENEIADYESNDFYED